MKRILNIIYFINTVISVFCLVYFMLKEDYFMVVTLIVFFSLVQFPLAFYKEIYLPKKEKEDEQIK